MRTHPLHTRHGPTAYQTRGKCSRCHIRITVPSGLCDDCATSAPLITYADMLGADRFFQVRTARPLEAFGYAARTRPTIRRKRGSK